MSSMLKNLNNIRSLRAMAREFSVDVLEDMLEKFRVVTKEQQAKINALLAQMQADGISPEELLSITPATTRSVKKRQPRPAKYRFIDLNGETKTWTGQGRTPKPIAQALAAGKSLDDFLI